MRIEVCIEQVYLFFFFEKNAKSFKITPEKRIKRANIPRMECKQRVKQF